MDSFCYLEFAQSALSCWDLWSGCQVRLLTPSAASLGHGELHFGVARSSQWSRGTLHALSLLAWYLLQMLSDVPVPSPKHRPSHGCGDPGLCWGDGWGGSRTARTKLDLHLLPSRRSGERWWDDLGHDTANVAVSGIRPGVCRAPQPSLLVGAPKGDIS